MHWCITKKQVHYKKLVHALQKNGRITKKRVPITSAFSLKPETRTIANPGHRHEWVAWLLMGLFTLGDHHKLVS